MSRSVSLTYNSDVSVVCFNVTIVDDTRYELREDFFVNITTGDPQVDLVPSSTIISILDDEGEKGCYPLIIHYSVFARYGVRVSSLGILVSWGWGGGIVRGYLIPFLAVL